MDQKQSGNQAPIQMAQHFLHLLDDVNRTQGVFMEEIVALRARIQELEAMRPEQRGSAQLPDIEGCAIYLESPEGLIQAWSGGAHEMYGYSVEEVVGCPVSTLLSAGPAKADKEGRGIFERTGKDGRAFQVLSRDVALQDGDGCLLGRLHLDMFPEGEP